MSQEPREYPPPKGYRTAIVTGASSGIGLACAKALITNGWHVAISGRRQDALNAAGDTIMRASETSARILPIVGDMSKEEDVVQLFKEAAAAFGGRIDMVFINAGIGASPVPIQDMNLVDWQSCVDVNLTGAWLCAREAFRYMAKDNIGGRIILNGSISAHTPRPNSAPYTATKHAISGLTKSLSLDGRAHNIAVSQIDIGNAASELTKKMRDGPGAPQPDGSVRQEPVFDTKHVADQIVHMAALPLDVNIQDIVIMATKMPSYIGRG